MIDITTPDAERAQRRRYLRNERFRRYRRRSKDKLKMIEFEADPVDLAEFC